MVAYGTHSTVIPMMACTVHSKLYDDASSSSVDAQQQDVAVADMLLPLYCFLLFGTLCQNLQEHLVCTMWLLSWVVFSIWPTLNSALSAEILGLVTLSLAVRGLSAWSRRNFPLPDGSQFVGGGALASALVIASVTWRSWNRLTAVLLVGGMPTHTGDAQPDLFSWVLHALALAVAVGTAAIAQRLATRAVLNW